MISIARASLKIDWRRNLAIISMLVLTGLLFYAQIAFLIQEVDERAWLATNSKGNLIVKKTGETGWMRGRTVDVDEFDILPLLKHKELTSIQLSPNHSFGYIRNTKNSNTVRVKIFAIHPIYNSNSFPEKMSVSAMDAYKMMHSFVISRKTANLYGLNLNEEYNIQINLNGPAINLKLVGFIEAKTISSQPIIFIHPTIYKALGQSNISYRNLILKTNIHDFRDLQLKINKAQSDGLRAFSKSDYLIAVREEALMERGFRLQLIVTVGLLSLFSLLIIAQIMRANIFAQLKEYAALHALGIPKSHLIWSNLEFGFLIGLISACSTILLFEVISFIMPSVWAEFYVTIEIYIYGFLQTVILSTLCSLLSISVFGKVNIMSLLR